MIDEKTLDAANNFVRLVNELIASTNTLAQANSPCSKETLGVWLRNRRIVQRLQADSEFIILDIRKEYESERQTNLFEQ